MKIYEYVVVKAEWFGGLDKGTRLYYDYDKNGYTYHYESERNETSNRYSSKSFDSTDYFMSLEIVDSQLQTDSLIAGPDLGEFETKSIEHGK